MPIGTFDRTPPLAPLSSGGMFIAAGAEVEVVPANTGRIKLILVHAGTEGTLWLGLGQTAQVGVGLPLGPGGALEEFIDCAVRVRNTSGADVNVTWIELGA